MASLSDFYILICLLINLDSFQQCERPRSCLSSRLMKVRVDLSQTVTFFGRVPREDGHTRSPRARRPGDPPSASAWKNPVPVENNRSFSTEGGKIEILLDKPVLEFLSAGKEKKNWDVLKLKLHSNRSNWCYWLVSLFFFSSHTFPIRRGEKGKIHLPHGDPRKSFFQLCSTVISSTSRSRILILKTDFVEVKGKRSVSVFLRYELSKPEGKTP